MNLRLVLAFVSVVMVAVSNQVTEAANPDPTIAIAVRFEHSSDPQDDEPDFVMLRSMLQEFLEKLEWGTTVESVALITCGGTTTAGTMKSQVFKGESASMAAARTFGNGLEKMEMKADPLATIANRTRNEFSSSSTVVIIIAEKSGSLSNPDPNMIASTLLHGADVVVFLSSYNQDGFTDASYHWNLHGLAENRTGGGSDLEAVTSKLREMVHEVIRTRRSVEPVLISTSPSPVSPPNDQDGCSYAEECYYNAEGDCVAEIVVTEPAAEAGAKISRECPQRKECDEAKCEDTCDKSGTWSECGADAACRDTKTWIPNRDVDKIKNCPSKTEYCRTREDCSSVADGNVAGMQGGVSVLSILLVVVVLVVIGSIVYAIMLKKHSAKIVAKGDQTMFGLPSLTTTPHTALVNKYAAKQSKSPAGSPKASIEKKAIKNTIKSPTSSRSDGSKSVKVSLPSKGPGKR